MSRRPAAAAAFFDAVIRSSLIEPEVIDLSPMGFHEHILGHIDADDCWYPLLELSDSATDSTVAGLLNNDLNQVLDLNQSGYTVGEWLAQRLTEALHERLMTLPPDAFRRRNLISPERWSISCFRAITSAGTGSSRESRTGGRS